jgi:hypothetical protein
MALYITHKNNETQCFIHVLYDVKRDWMLVTIFTVNAKLSVRYSKTVTKFSIFLKTFTKRCGKTHNANCLSSILNLCICVEKAFIAQRPFENLQSLRCQQSGFDIRSHISHIIASKIYFISSNYGTKIINIVL